jgi:hypothetical protein
MPRIQCSRFMTWNVKLAVKPNAMRLSTINAEAPSVSLKLWDADDKLTFRKQQNDSVNCLVDAPGQQHAVFIDAECPCDDADHATVLLQRVPRGRSKAFGNPRQHFRIRRIGTLIATQFRDYVGFVQLHVTHFRFLTRFK